LSNKLLLTVLLTLLPGQAPAQTGAPKNFKFTQLEDKLLEEVELIDRQFDKKGLVFGDPALESHLEQIARPILEAAGTPERVHWRFRILRDPSVNAFALPNGSIYLHTGILSLLENDAQLAGVLAHEITHVTNRHTFEQYRSYRKKMVTVHVLSGLSAWTPGAQAWGSAIRIVSEFGGIAVILSVIGYSRELEREADIFAVDRVSAAGYDPMQVPRTFQLLDEKLEIEPVRTFYRDHPKLEDRVKYTTAMAQSKPAAAAVPDTSTAYLALAERAVRYNVQADLDSRRFRTAVARAQRLTGFRPNDPSATVLLAEAYRALGARTAEPPKEEIQSPVRSGARRRLNKRTAEEEESELLAQSGGPEIRKANLEKSEELFRKALTSDSSFAPAWRGLGFLYEEQSKPADALPAYRKYLDLAPNAPDKLRVQRRIEGITKEPAR
jgi:predicted Zn-dependent protease